MIDCHVHIGKSEKTRRSFSFEEYYNLMTEHGVTRSIVMPNISGVIKTSTYNQEFIDDYLQFSYNYVFHPLIVINPRDRQTLVQIDTLKKYIHGVKFHPSIAEVTLTGNMMVDYIKKAVENHLPILVHCGRNYRSNIKYILQVAKQCPNGTFIAAHLGGNATDLIEKAIDEVGDSQVNNVYLDTSAGKMPWLIEKAVARLGPDKILFGSDEPYADLRIGIHCVNLCSLSFTDKYRVFTANSRRVFKC